MVGGLCFLFLAMLCPDGCPGVGGVGLLVEIWIVDASIFVAAAHVAPALVVGVGCVVFVCCVVLVGDKL